jgi:hypothetical protein
MYCVYWLCEQSKLQVCSVVFTVLVSFIITYLWPQYIDVKSIDKCKIGTNAFEKCVLKQRTYFHSCYFFGSTLVVIFSVIVLTLPTPIIKNNVSVLSYKT